jgi:hypothetical protein
LDGRKQALALLRKRLSDVFILQAHNSFHGQRRHVAANQKSWFISRGTVAICTTPDSAVAALKKAAAFRLHLRAGQIEVGREVAPFAKALRVWLSARGC